MICHLEDRDTDIPVEPNQVDVGRLQVPCGPF